PRQPLEGALLSAHPAVDGPVGHARRAETGGRARLLRGLLLWPADSMAALGPADPALVRPRRRGLHRVPLPGGDPAAPVDRAGAAELSAGAASSGDDPRRARLRRLLPQPAVLGRIRAPGAPLHGQRSASIVSQHSGADRRGGAERLLSRPALARHEHADDLRLAGGNRLLLPAAGGPAVQLLVLLPGGAAARGAGLRAGDGGAGGAPRRRAALPGLSDG